MLFAYRVLELGSFIVPGGVFVFPITYSFADIVAQVYGYTHAKLLIWGNLACIVIFNIANSLLLQSPPLDHGNIEAAYQMVFGHNFSLLLGFGLSFGLTDFISAYFISKWKLLEPNKSNIFRRLLAKHFWFRYLTCMLISQTIFTCIATLTIYFNNLSPELVIRQFTSTWMIKVLIIMILTYPTAFLAALLKRIEKYDAYDVNVTFNPFKFK